MATSKMPSFQRARQPAQIEQRKEAILRTALLLFQRNGLENVSLTDIAREVGLAKSNIYRYFRKPRAYLFGSCCSGWRPGLSSASIRRWKSSRARAPWSRWPTSLPEAYIDSPEYGELITVVNSVLEKRLTPPLLINFRSVFLERRKRLVRLFSPQLCRRPPPRKCSHSHSISFSMCPDYGPFVIPGRIRRSYSMSRSTGT